MAALFGVVSLLASSDLPFREQDKSATPILPLLEASLADWLSGRPADIRAWIQGSGFAAKSGQFLRMTGEHPMLVGMGDDARWGLGAVPAALPAGVYRLVDPVPNPDELAQAWALGSYRFERYRKTAPPLPTLCWPEGADRAAVERLCRATALVRDLINTPANDMGPSDLEAVAADQARAYGGTVQSLVGDALLDEGYALIHAVGYASPRAPRLIDLRWGDPTAPKVTLVGKGVCFDTGGLNIKPADAMLRMKKDMGGAAHVLGLASMVMDAGLALRLRVLIPAVDNAIGGSAFRPLDIVRSRAGPTVEIGHTDAEGRLVLCDPLAEASSEAPELLIDMATLTSGARAALGPDVPALLCNDEILAADLLDAAARTGDPLWRLPLWRPYDADLNGKVADLNNVAHSSFAGAIYGGLFLERFVKAGTPWAHIDLFGWNLKDRPGRPEGGEAQTLRAVFHLLRERYGR